MLEAIKTGNADEACKNLVFFVGLGLLDDDPQHTIRKSCNGKPTGAPSLPVAAAREPFENPVLGTGRDPSRYLRGHVYDADSGKPIPGALVRIDFGFPGEDLLTDAEGAFLSKSFAPLSAAGGEVQHGKLVKFSVSKKGYVTCQGPYPTEVDLTIRLKKAVESQ